MAPSCEESEEARGEGDWLRRFNDLQHLFHVGMSYRPFRRNYPKTFRLFPGYLEIRVKKTEELRHRIPYAELEKWGGEDGRIEFHLRANAEVEMTKVVVWCKTPKELSRSLYGACEILSEKYQKDGVTVEEVMKQELMLRDN